MESLNFVALSSLLDKEKQQMLLSQVNLISAPEKEEGQSASPGASVQVPPTSTTGIVYQSEENSAINSFTAEELLASGKEETVAHKYFKLGKTSSQVFN